MRSAVIQYCNIGVGNENANRLVLDYPMHPRLAKAYQYLQTKFLETIIRDHNLLTNETHREKMLGFIPRAVNSSDDLKSKMSLIWNNKIQANPDIQSDELWEAFTKFYNDQKTA